MNYCFYAGKEYIKYQEHERVTEMKYFIKSLDELINKSLLDLIDENTALNKTSVICLIINEHFKINGLPCYNEGNIDILKELVNQGKKIKICFMPLYGEKLSFPIEDKLVKLFDMLRENNIDFYFDIKLDTWAKLKAFESIGVSDFYIGGDLGFELPQIKKVYENIKIRCMANYFDYTPAIKQEHVPLKYGFFVKPENTKSFEFYIDVIEFGMDSVKDQSVYFEVYELNGKWMGELREIILGMTNDVISYKVPVEQFVTRNGCKHECIKGGKCSVCDRAEDLSRLLKETPIYFRAE